MKNLLQIILVITCSIMIYAISINKLIPYKSNDYDTIYQPIALIATENLRRKLSSLVKEIDQRKNKVWCLVAPPKSKSSLSRKIFTKYPRIKSKSGEMVNDFENINDLIRSSLVFQDLDTAYSLINKLNSIFGEPIKIGDYFKNLNDDKFRDIEIIYQFSNDYFVKRDKNLAENEYLPEKFYLKFEIEINICDSLMIKENEHFFYELSRFISKIDKEKPFEKMLLMENKNQKDFDEIIKNVIEKIKYYIPNEFSMWDSAYNTWNKDKNNKIKINNLLNETLKIERKMNDSIYNKYLNEKKLNNFTCNLDFIVDNSNCNFIGGDLSRILEAGGKLIKRLLE